MSENATDNLDNIVKDVEDKDNDYRRALRKLLDWASERKGHLIATPAKMGGADSYITSVSLKWIAANVRYAKDLPVFKPYISGDKDPISINDITRDLIQQREPDYRRQLPMAMYLATRKYHKFGPLIIVAYKDWVYEKDSDQWGPDGRALEPSLGLKSLDSKMCLVDLDIENTKYFALDGQHRLMAIKGLGDLLNGRLEAKRKDGTSIPKKAVTSDDIEEYYEENGERFGFDINSFQGLLDEVMGIEIIPAVQDDELFKEATSRLRNIFVDINENARRLEKGELTLLDENDGFRIVSRIILTGQSLFGSGNQLRVNTKTNNITENSEDYTTLNTIVEISREYLKSDRKFKEWLDPILSMAGLGYLRPEDQDIDAAVSKLNEYFDALKSIPSHKDMIQGTSIQSFRSRKDKDNILFWPIAQVAFATAVADLQIEKGKSLDDLVSMVAKYEAKEQLRLTDPKTPWFGILCDPIDKKIRRQKQYQVLCTEMLIYLLGGGLQDETRETLREKFFNARRGGTEEGKSAKAYDLTGELRSLNEHFHLPDPWQ